MNKYYRKLRVDTDFRIIVDVFYGNIWMRDVHTRSIRDFINNANLIYKNNYSINEHGDLVGREPI